MEFQEIKDYVIARAIELKACSGELARVKKATNNIEILQVVSENRNWCTINGLFSEKNIEIMFTKEDLIEASLYNSGSGNIGFSNTGHSNTGDWNTGHSNTGDSNTGHRNTGDRNTGHRNTGDRNTGDSNTGDWNTGDWNTGDSNTGDSNTGHRNTGDRNTGHRNTGDRNTGDRNTGDWNTGDRNTGVFNTIEPTIRLFNKESNWTYQDWTNSEACRLSYRFVLTEWVYENNMTDQEKIDNPRFNIQEGFLKKYEYKEACQIWWNKLTKDERNSFKELPNFSSEIFKEITGIDF